MLTVAGKQHSKLPLLTLTSKLLLLILTVLQLSQTEFKMIKSDWWLPTAKAGKFMLTRYQNFCDRVSKLIRQENQNFPKRHFSKFTTTNFIFFAPHIPSGSYFQRKPMIIASLRVENSDQLAVCLHSPTTTKYQVLRFGVAPSQVAVFSINYLERM